MLILPYLEQEALYKEFHLDEPWDSPHNRTLIARMPAGLPLPDGIRRRGPRGQDALRRPARTGTVFRGAEPVSIKEITDGTSNTIIFVDAGDDRAVTWTKPDDWDVPPDADGPFEGIFDGASVPPIATGTPSRPSPMARCGSSRRRSSRHCSEPWSLTAGGEVISPEDF